MIGWFPIKSDWFGIEEFPEENIEGGTQNVQNRVDISSEMV